MGDKEFHTHQHLFVMDLLHFIPIPHRSLMMLSIPQSPLHHLQYQIHHQSHHHHTICICSHSLIHQKITKQLLPKPHQQNRFSKNAGSGKTWHWEMERMNLFLGHWEMERSTWFLEDDNDGDGGVVLNSYHAQRRLNGFSCCLWVWK